MKRGRLKHNGNEQVFYDQFFTTKHVHEAAYDLRHSLRKEAISRALEGLRRDAVLVDVGCGVGSFSNAAAPQCKLVGIDLSIKDLLMARQKDCALQFLQGSALAMPFRVESVDAVLCLEVIEHLPDDARALRALAKILKVGGVLVLSVPNTFYFPDYLPLIGHYRHYTREELVRLLEAVGLKVVKYLETYPVIELIHYYPFILLSGIHRLLNKVGLRGESLYVRPILGNVYQIVRWGLLLFKKGRTQERLGQDEGSTFVLARKG